MDDRAGASDEEDVAGPDAEYAVEQLRAAAVLGRPRRAVEAKQRAFFTDGVDVARVAAPDAVKLDRDTARR